VDTRVGYAGGTTIDPVYHHMGDHTETIQIDYDPAVVTYDELLDIFWSEHNPSRREHSRQYRSVILYGSEEERAAAEASRARVVQRAGWVGTAIEPLGVFTLAEEYHQHYYQKQVMGGLFGRLGRAVG